MKDGDRNNTKGSASLSPLLGEVIVEGPLKKGKSSWIASMRRSLIEHTSPTLLGEEQPLYFESQYLKMCFFGEGNSRCSVMGMHTYDRVNSIRLKMTFSTGEIWCLEDDAWYFLKSQISFLI